ncbi:MAG: response regulator [Actinobacteria bacterium]|nr:response regulator [Actinomycetota bacterium]
MHHRILVVDDDASIRDMLEMVLTLEGFEVHTAADGLSAIEQAKALKPDVIVLDIMMPGLSGREVAELLRQAPQTADTPIIFCSALAGSDDVWAGYQAGATSYVSKPFDNAVIISEVLNGLAAAHIPGVA